MDTAQVHALMNSCSLPGTCSDQVLMETHISWIILSGRYAFKIKKPVRYSFVDFSTPEIRRQFCYEEVRLNRRLAPGMYLGVLPLSGKMTGKAGGDKGDRVIEHAVYMKRMDGALRMDKLLKQKKVNKDHVKRLAGKIAGFHKKTEVAVNGTANGLQELYADLLSVVPFLGKLGAGRFSEIVTGSIEKSKSFLQKNALLLGKRKSEGFIRDCHGDLNVYNIFLYPDPVIFDCIEFNRDLRHIDILSEIAFICTDLDFFGMEELSELFYHEYAGYLGLQDEPASRRLFTYYKSYRANIRAKVTLTDEMKKVTAVDSGKLDDAWKYLRQMDKYINACHG